MSRGQRTWLNVVCLMAICATTAAMQPLQRAAQTVAMQAVGQQDQHVVVNQLHQMDAALQNVIAVSGWSFLIGSQSTVIRDGVVISKSAQLVVLAQPAEGMPIMVQLVFSWGWPTPDKWTMRGFTMWVDNIAAIPKVQAWLDEIQGAPSP